MPGRVSLSLLGGFDVRFGAASPLALPRKSQALLAYLALAPRGTRPRDELASLLWGDTGEAQARQSLRKALSGLRRSLNRGRPPLIVVTPRSVGLNTAAVSIDAT